MPIGLEHAGANRNDHTLPKATLDSIPTGWPKPTKESPQGICLDRDHDNREGRQLAASYGLEPHIASRREGMEQRLGSPGWRARRWVVEAAHSWLNRNRSLLIRWSKKAENHLAFLQLASPDFRR